MAIEITVPRLGWSMEEGVFGQWLKQPGDHVRPGEMLFVLEGDKAAQEIECFDEGFLHVPASAPKAGESVKVGQMLGWLLAKDEPPPPVSPSPAAGEGRGEGLPASRLHVPPSPASTHENATRHIASPRARRTAKANGIDWRKISGTGAGGRVRERDVIAFSTQHTEGKPFTPTRPQLERAKGKLTPISPTRRLTAERMLASAQQTAPVTLTTTVDATNLVNLGEQFRSPKPATQSNEPAPTYTDLILKLAAMTLVEHPSLCAQWREDGLFQPDQVNIAFAVDTPHGLVAPVANEANLLSLRRLAAITRDLASRARERKLAPHETQNGTFTVTNLGGLGIDAFTPIINLPQTAILGVGRIRLAPAVVDGQIAARQQLTLSLTFDHRVLDGAAASRLSQALGQSIEKPAARLIE